MFIEFDRLLPGESEEVIKQFSDLARVTIEDPDDTERVLVGLADKEDLNKLYDLYQELCDAGAVPSIDTSPLGIEPEFGSLDDFKDDTESDNQEAEQGEDQEQHDLDVLKSVAKMMIYMKIEETEYSPIIISHPLLISGYMTDPETDEWNNLLQNREALRKWQKNMEDTIQNCSNFSAIMTLINKPYKLAFIKSAYYDISINTLSEIWGDTWPALERITNNEVFTEGQMVSIFKRCVPAILMSEDDLRVFESLPSKITVYRGIQDIAENLKGMSWTLSIEKAKWFSERWSKGGKSGGVYKVTVDKANVLAYFGNRGEQEIVVDPRCLKDIEKVETE